MTQASVRTRMALIDYYEQRIQDEQNQLDYMTINSSWFRIRQVTGSGDEVDITEREKDRIRRAVADYRRAIEYLNALE